MFVQSRILITNNHKVETSVTFVKRCQCCILEHQIFTWLRTSAVWGEASRAVRSPQDLHPFPWQISGLSKFLTLLFWTLLPQRHTSFQIPVRSLGAEGALGSLSQSRQELGSMLRCTRLLASPCSFGGSRRDSCGCRMWGPSLSSHPFPGYGKQRTGTQQQRVYNGKFFPTWLHGLEGCLNLLHACILCGYTRTCAFS